MNEQLRPGTYPSVRATNWRDDTTQNGDPILRVTFDVQGFEVEWTCWMNDMFKDGKPSSNLRGLQALGVTEADLTAWSQGEELRGLDRNAVTVVVESNKNGYSIVKWVNDPREMRQSKPLDRGQRAQVGQKMAQALQAMKLREQTEQRGSLPDRARRTPENDPGFNPEDWDKGF